jgi:hypothetical protein
MNGRFDRLKTLAPQCTMAAALALCLAGTASFAGNNPKPPSDNTGGPEVKCRTKLPEPMLVASEPAKHEFHAFPANRATESGTFTDGAQLNIEVTGCSGPVLTKMTLALPGAAGTDKVAVAAAKKLSKREQKKAQAKIDKATKADKRPERKTIGPLVDYLNANLDAFAKTPLGLPNAARALAAINEAKMSYPEGDRICLAKDNPVVVPQAQRCGKVLTIWWSEGPHKTYTISYSAD